MYLGICDCVGLRFFKVEFLRFFFSFGVIILEDLVLFMSVFFFGW